MANLRWQKFISLGGDFVECKSRKYVLGGISLIYFWVGCYKVFLSTLLTLLSRCDILVKLANANLEKRWYSCYAVCV
jgi:hypothetical protein